MGMILRIASSRIVGQGDIVGRSGYFSLNLSANSVMRGRLDARRTLKSLVADLRETKGFLTMVAANYLKPKDTEISNWIVDAVILLEEGETTAFCTVLTSFLADIPYNSHGSIKTVEATEKHFQYTFYLILRLLGVYCRLHVEYFTICSSALTSIPNSRPAASST